MLNVPASKRGKRLSVFFFSLCLSLFFFCFFFKMYCIHGTYAAECRCHANELQNGTGSGRWPTDAHRTATSFSLRIQPKIFTITLKATYILIWPSSNERERDREREGIKLISSICQLQPCHFVFVLNPYNLFISGLFYFKKVMWRAAVSAIKGGPPGSSGCD